MLIDKVSPVCEIVFNFIQFPSATRLGLRTFYPVAPTPPLLGRENEKRKLHDIAFLGIRFKDFLLTSENYATKKDAAA